MSVSVQCNWLSCRYTIRFVMLAIFLPTALPSLGQSRVYGPAMCPCPGSLPKPLGNASSCEEACFGPRTPSGPAYDDGAAQRAREAEEARREAEEARQRQAAERLRRQEEAARQEQFIRDRDAAANSLKGSSGGAASQLRGLAGSDNSGLKGSGFDTGSQLKPAPAPIVDSRVVDARNVPSGLPKGLDSAIATAYSSAPPGVSDRVRKGFQAVMARDWKVAKAWFQDALNRDPSNAGLKRLVALSDPSQQRNPPPAMEVDNRSEPAGLGGRPTGASAPLNRTRPASASTIDPDLELLFPGLRAMKDREAPVYKTLSDGTRIQLPQVSDMEFLLGPPAQPLGSKSAKSK